MNIGFSLPEIEFHIQIFIISLQIRNGYLHDMVPQRTISSHTALQLKGGFHCFFLISRVFLGFTACSRIDLLKLGNGKGRLSRIFSRIGLVKIDKGRLSLLKFLYDQSHLKPPVPKMNVTDHLMTGISCNSLDALPDNSRAQMPYMKGLCHIGSAIINDDLLGMFRCVQSEFVAGCHLI